MFRIVVNGLLIGYRRSFGNARDLAIKALNSYTQKPIVTIEDSIGNVVEHIK